MKPLVILTLLCASTALASELPQILVGSGVDNGSGPSGGIEMIRLAYGTGIRSYGYSGSGTYSLLKMAHVSGIGTTPETNNYALLGDPRMDWLSVPTTLDLVGNSIIDVTDIGNRAGLYNTRLVQRYCSTNLYAGIATVDASCALKDRVIVESYKANAAVIVTNAALRITGDTFLGSRDNPRVHLYLWPDASGAFLRNAGTNVQFHGQGGKVSFDNVSSLEVARVLLGSGLLAFDGTNLTINGKVVLTQ